jgi:hypothetical protein
MDKFLLAENPMRPDDSGIWIVHLLDPIAIIACEEGEVERGSVFKHYHYVNGEGIAEFWTLSIYFANGKGDIEAKAFKLLDRAWRWYRAYMEWEDSGINDEERGQLN